MTKSSKYFIIFLAGALAGVFVIAQYSFREKSHFAKIDKASYTWHAPDLPSKMDFAGEAVPLDRWEVKERLDREMLYNYYLQHNILYMLKLANRYFPLIEQKLKEHNLPDDFKYLCVAESNLMNATSRAGAVGFWQFMSYTAPGYNLEISKEVDERYDVSKSTEAACKYLKNAYARFNSWTAAAASYNCGMGGYNANATYQGTNNYYDLLLPEETNRYIFRILALKHLIQNAEQLGYRLEPEEAYEPVATRTVKVTSSIPNLATFANNQGTTYKMLKLLNPWLRAKSLTVKPGKSYTIALPEN